ncbi:Cell division coordinator CpoB [Methylocella tundrae]|uniref:Cell division coordinator CpoB n=1 Tax=Methylocella tundrae TaxID=227605 RepID=A0A8B6M781_METTU|nr:tol-pal system protein YbgF [Methylocella tundrae]VTZ25460.1 Cell division coordinator CpoB [Methylocella tundrae]VTZ49932.1 Cell division coordinator CpoB [Methylocella tundrae]
MRHFETLFRVLLGACAAGFLCGAVAGASPRAEAAGAPERLAQNFGAPPGDVGDGQPDDASTLLVRIDRLESQMRQMNGQIEQLQFQNHKLEDQLKKFQEDVDFRFQDSGRPGAAAPSAAKPQKRSDAIDNLIDAGDQPGEPPSSATPPSVTPGSARPSRRGDAFDPSNDPNAPGAPRTLGSAPPSPAARVRTSAVPDEASPDAPLDLSGAKWRAAPADAPPSGSPATANPPVAALTTPNSVAPGAAPINPVKEEFDVAYGYLRQKEYESAEKSFAAFIQKNPRSRMTADATYYLGESFFQRNRPREAAEQYLKMSTQYATSPRAPEAMLRLGQSLNALGAKEQACATFAEIGRKYPGASAAVKAGADREAKRAQC